MARSRGCCARLLYPHRKPSREVTSLQIGKRNCPRGSRPWGESFLLQLNSLRSTFESETVTLEIVAERRTPLLRRSIAEYVFLGFLAAATVAVASPPAVAQSLWIVRDSDHTIILEMLRPNLEGVDAEFLSAAFFLSGRAKISPNLAMVGEFPYVRHASSQMGTDIDGNEIVVELSSSTVGNIYLGMETHDESSPIFAELGVRLPLASDEEDDALATGYLSDVVRQEAFYENTVSINAAFNLREVTSSKVAYRLRLSPVLAIPEENGPDDPELFAAYSFLIGYHGLNARIGGGMSGRALVTEDSGNLGERTLSQLELHADFLSGSLRPGLDLRLPLGPLSEFVPVALGVSISWVR